MLQQHYRQDGTYACSGNGASANAASGRTCTRACTAESYYGKARLFQPLLEFSPTSWP